MTSKWGDSNWEKRMSNRGNKSKVLEVWKGLAGSMNTGNQCGYNISSDRGPYDMRIARFIPQKALKWHGKEFRFNFLRDEKLWIMYLKSYSEYWAGDGVRDGLKRGMRNLLGVMQIFCILIVVVLSWVHISVKIYQIVSSNCTITSNHLLYVN